MQQYPVSIGTMDSNGVTIMADYRFPSPEAAMQFIQECHEAYARLCQGGVRRSAIINPITKKDFKCPNRN